MVGTRSGQLDGIPIDSQEQARTRPELDEGDRSIGEVGSGDGKADAQVHGTVGLVGLRAATRDGVGHLLPVVEHGSPHVRPRIALRCSASAYDTRIPLRRKGVRVAQHELVDRRQPEHGPSLPRFGREEQPGQLVVNGQVTTQRRVER